MRSVDGDKHGKEKYLARMLEHIRLLLTHLPIVTLSDKDWSEINAFLKAFPESRHQLCYWHALRAVKQRLAVLRRRPKFYNVVEAASEFDFIDRDFVPIGQVSPEQLPGISRVCINTHCSIPVANMSI